ncbi:MAG: hypothetical protein ACSLE9_06695 [Burkholderiaceae bacterium]
MSRILTFFLVLLFSLVANAQIALPLKACITDRPDWAIPAAAKPQGLPQQLGGTCGTAIVEANATGAAAAFWCRNPAPQPATLYLYAVRWSAITAPMLLVYAQQGLPGVNAERIRAMQAKYQTANVWDMCDVWEPAIARINASMPAPTPVPAWTVAKNGTLTTRPAFAYNANSGKRSYSSTSKATVGAACDMSVTLVEGATTYGLSSPGFVAVCTKTP